MAENQGIIDAIKQGNKDAGKVLKDEIAEGIKPAINTLLEPLSQMKSGIMMLPGMKMTTKLFSAVTKPLKESFASDKSTSAKEQVTQNEKDRKDTITEQLFVDIRDGIFAISTNLLEGLKGLKDKGLMGLGLLAGLVAAPIMALVAFFTQFGKEVAMLGKGIKAIFRGPFNVLKTFFTNMGDYIKNSKIATLFDSVMDSVKIFFGNMRTNIKLFFTNIGTRFMNSPVGQFLDEAVKGVKLFFTNIGTRFMNSPVGQFLDEAVKGVKLFFTNLSSKFSFIKLDQVDDIAKGFSGFGSKIVSFFAPIKNVFTSVDTAFGITKPFLAGMKPALDFASRIGTALAKIFFPITVIMGVFDVVTGFMEGYKDEGTIFAGVREGIAKAVGTLIGMPLDLLKKGVNFLIKFFFGESKVTEFLDDLDFLKVVKDLVRLPFNLVEGAFNFVKELFGDPIGTLKKTFTGENSIFSIVSGAIGKVVDFLKGIFDIDIKGIVSSLPFGDKLLSFFEEDSLAEQIAAKEAEVAGIQKDVNSDGFFETKGNREKNERELLEAQRELEELRAQQRAGGGTTVVNNYNSTASSNSTTVTTQNLQDAAVATGSTMQ